MIAALVPALGTVAPIALVLAALAAAYLPLGGYLAQVFSSPRHTLPERALYRLMGVRPDTAQRWPRYAASVLVFSALGLVALYLLQRAQAALPLAQGMGPVAPATAWNTAASFITNTNWQSYAGEATMSPLTQMMGLAVQNFLSAAVGLSVAVALIRGCACHDEQGRIGNFWVDLTRGVLRVLLPLAVLAAAVLLSQGVIQNLHPAATVSTFTGGSQVIPGGPVASQEAIKELGTNGGGYFGANSAHPMENPTALSNAVEVFLLLLLPVCLTRTFGVMVGDRRQGWALLGATSVLFFTSLAAVVALEGGAAGGLEGREMRFGTVPSAFFAVATTMTSTGAVDSAHSSYSPLGGGVLLLNMLLGEISPGGVGSGLYGLLVVALLAVFVAGLMVGRTPEYLGKRIGLPQIIKICLYLLVMPALVLGGVALSVVLPGTRASLSTASDAPHALTELVYAFASAANNNGSAFAGLQADASWFQISLGVVMLLGRFLPMIAVLALAGSLAAQAPRPVTAGTLPTHRPLFVALLVGVALVVGALTFLPVLVLGPLVEASSL
ncbi:potassium-transporting ATPase subunit KdpA [Corynebacterium sp. zg-331]|uniref:potassium-transporting ATPase subunit KdpA n=1 Tax=unclassified Corynebacterium TaxID=2624378 RepID=UPI00128E513D|nr:MULTISPECIES: potassium-transporting ATPase subunit KdpA [unclassified Corynebacterium]MBC3185665.1 potassium-transporting ATPase subunit KdpA [Corynebacterium sp. zg-331]MPV52159.1 potassium-transporting ATPase subunit KdpA [Corynebacterium sp. zg331]